MKKKGLAIFALAAVMSLGAMGITAFAAGWSQEGSNWVYYNNNGSKVRHRMEPGVIWKAAEPWQPTNGSITMITM